MCNLRMKKIYRTMKKIIIIVRRMLDGKMCKTRQCKIRSNNNKKVGRGDVELKK